MRPHLNLLPKSQMYLQLPALGHSANALAGGSHGFQVATIPTTWF